MKIKQVRRFYILIYILAIFITIFAKIVFDQNILPEVGATIIVLAILRARQVILSIKWASEDFIDSNPQLKEKALLWDANAAIVGTLVNGYSVGIYSILCVFM